MANDEMLKDAHRAVGVAMLALLGVIADHDRRTAWAEYGATSEARYLVAALGVRLGTAAAWVKCAHALERNPDWGAGLANGEWCFDQLVGFVDLMAAEQPGSTDPVGPFDDPTPHPTPDPPPDPTPDAPNPRPTLDPEDVTAGLSAEQLAARARAAKRRTEEEANAAFRHRRFRGYDCDNGTGVRVEGVFYDDAAATVRAFLDEYLRTVDKDPITGRYPDIEHSQADAFVEACAAWLGGREGVTNRPAVTFHADVAIVEGEDGWAETTSGAPLASATVRRLMCDCHVNFQLDRGSNGLYLGRSARLPNWQLADHVRRRDRGCRFPGCRRRRFTQTHHILEWDADKGPTDHDNLCELCRYHHRLVHEGGWDISGVPTGQLTFTSPDGQIALVSQPNQASRPPDPPPDPPLNSPPDGSEEQLFATA